MAVLRPVDHNLTGLSQDMSDTIGACAHRGLPRRQNGVDRLIDEGCFHGSPPASSPLGSPSLDNRELFIYQARRTDLHAKTPRIHRMGEEVQLSRRNQFELTG